VAEVSPGLDPAGVVTVADPGADLRLPWDAAGCPPPDSWQPGSLDDGLEARSGEASVWTGTEMLVWGGTRSDAFGVTQTGRRYDR
jgi:hypothetical protein